MKSIFYQLTPILLSLIFFMPSQAVQSQDEILSFEQMKQNRQKAIDAFESSSERTPVYYSKPQALEGSEKKEFHQYSFEAMPYQAGDQSKIEKTEALKIPETQGLEKLDLESPDYIHKLSKALPCFRAFMGDLYQARFKRDSKITKCATNGNEACAQGAAGKFEKASMTITDKFYICLDTRETDQTADLSR